MDAKLSDDSQVAWARNQSRLRVLAILADSRRPVCYPVPNKNSPLLDTGGSGNTTMASTICQDWFYA
jgi:hypothetical protein